MLEDSGPVNEVEDQDVDAVDVSSGPKFPLWSLLGGAAVVVSGTVVATLAATHQSARHENAKAYVHGMNDVLKSVRQSIRDGVDPFDI